MKNRKQLLTMLAVYIIISAFVPVFGQITITGVVQDFTSGEPLVGATVLQKNTTRGVVTDINGNYSIQVDNESTVLVFSFIGYATDEIAVGNQRVINAALVMSMESLQELVVIGYGTQKKNDLTGAISVVESEAIARANSVSVTQAIQGRVSGAYITERSGAPGSGSTVRVRGVNSINAGSDPAFVVDGIVVGVEFFNALNPNDIESVSVLKDASATAIYGARGANGVVLITTKKGRNQQPKVAFSSFYGTTNIPKFYDLMNADQYSDLTNAAWDMYLEQNPGGRSKPMAFSDEIREKNGWQDNDWQQLITRQGIKQNYNLSILGGSENATYSLSGDYYNETGTMIGTGFERYSIRGSHDYQVKPWLKIGTALHYAKLNYDNQSHKGENPWRLATISSPLMKIYEPANKGGFGGPIDSITGSNDKSNPVADQMLNTNERLENRLMAIISAEIKPVKWISYSFNYGYEYLGQTGFQWSPQYYLGPISTWNNPSAYLREQSYNFQKQELQNLVSMNKSVDKHNVQFLIGQSMEYSRGRDFNLQVLTFEDESLRVINQGQEVGSVGGALFETKYLSYFSRLNYDFQNRYLFTASLRRDASSRFGEKNRVGYFPSFSLGWKFNEDFLQDVEQISMAKLRLGWGVTGNANLADYQYYERLVAPRETRYVFGVNEDVYFGLTPLKSFGNPYLRWEESRTTNIGLDVYAFNNQLEFTAEYYYKKQTGMLVTQELPLLGGREKPYSNAWKNEGENMNKGVEFNAIYKKRQGSFHYTINANITTIYNEILSLPGNTSVFHGYSITQVGKPIGAFYGYVAEGIFQSNEEVASHASQSSQTTEGDIRFKDLNLDGMINDQDRTVIGKPIPDFVYGLNFDLSYKMFDLSLFFYGVQGVDIYNNLRSEIGIATDRESKDWNKLTSVLDYWTPENKSQTMTKASVVDANRNSRISSFFIEDGSYFRLKTLQFGVTLPNNWMSRIQVDKARLYYSTNNIFTLTGYKGLDPELSNAGNFDVNVDFGSYPVPKSHMLGLQVNF